MKNVSSNAAETPAALATKSALPLIGAQLGIWLADQFSVCKNEFTVAQYVDIAGEIDPLLFQQAIATGLAEADSLHSQYIAVEGNPLQLLRCGITPQDISAIEIFDLSHSVEPMKTALARMQSDSLQSRDVTHTDSPYLHLLFQLSADPQAPRWIWYQRYHHLMVDGYSFSAINKRIVNIYADLSEGRTATVTPFKPVAAMVQEYIAYQQSEKFLRDRDFWSDYSQQLVSPLSLAQQSPVRLKQTQKNSSGSLALRHKINIDSSGVSHILNQLNDKKVAAADVLMSLVFIYIARMTGSNKVVVGFPFMRRMGSSALFSTAPAVNVLPLQIEILTHFTLADTINSLLWEMRKLRKYQKYEAEQIQRDLGLAGSHEKLYGVTLNCKLFDYQLGFPGVASETFQLATGPIDDMEFAIYLHKNAISIELAANPKLYSHAELEQHGLRLQTLFAQLASNNPLEFKLHNVTLLSRPEAKLIQQWQQPEKLSVTEYGKNILHSFDYQVRQQPENIALVCQHQNLSFSQLSSNANQLSRALLTLLKQQHSNNQPPVIAVALPRSAQSIIAIIAIFRINAVYLPLDLNYPCERLLMMCDDAQPAILITLSSLGNLSEQGKLNKLSESSELSDKLPAHIKRLYLDKNSTQEQLSNYSSKDLNADEFACIINPQQLAYLFYTSGSTGKPKGVLVAHKAMINLMAALQSRSYRAAQQQLNNKRMRVALTGSLSFDTSWDPIFLMMLGHQLFIFGDEIKRDVNALIYAIDQQKIDMLALAPTLASQLLAAGLMEKNQYLPTLMNICGEAVSEQLWQQLQQYPQLHAHNIYGPTEFTVYATSVRVSEKITKPNIGVALANTQTYVLDRWLKPVPIGVIGTLYLAGENMSDGYLNRPAANATRFVANPFVAGEIMYFTGDLVRWNSGGELEFIGRNDDQVKIRGHRIELAEVEAVCVRLPIVKQAVVLSQTGDSGERLVSYCVVDQSATLSNSQTIALIKDKLAQTLPDYMIPSIIVLVENIPLTVSGKIDKRALPAAEITINNHFVAPVSALEKLLVDAVKNVLSLEMLGMQDDFFQLAGDSISAMRLSSLLETQGYQLLPQDIFSERTLFKMLARIKSIEPAQSAPNSFSKKSRANKLDDVSRSARVRIHSGKLFPLEQEQLIALDKGYNFSCDVLPTLALQAGLLFHAQLQQRSHNYSFTTRLSISGELNHLRLENALTQVINAFPQLAAIFDSQTCGISLQIIPQKVDEDANGFPDKNSQLWPFNKIDLSHLSKKQQAQQLHQLEMNEAKRQFVLRNAPKVPLMVHATLVYLGGQQQVLLLSFHHLIIDGWSMPILLQTLFEAYREQTLNIVNNDDYVNLVKQLSSRDPQPSIEAWKSYLSGVVPSIAFSETNDTETNDTVKIRELKLPVAPQLMQQLQKFGRDEAITINSIMQTVWGILLSSLVGKNSVVFGSPVSGRSAHSTNIESQVGLFSNTLPVKIDIDPANSLLQQLQHVQKTQIEMLMFDDLGLGEIQRQVNSESLFDTLLVVENYPLKESLWQQEFAGIQLTQVENRGYTHYPLTILFLPGDNPRILFEYRNCVANAESLAHTFLQLLQQLVNNPHQQINQLELLTEVDQKLIEKTNNTQHQLSVNTLTQRLARQAQQTPNRTALQDENESISYLQMRKRVDLIAEQLTQYLSIRENIIAVALPRSVNLSVALQSVLEVGAAYLPLEIDYPDERLALMLQDANPVCLITSKVLSERFIAINTASNNIQLIFIEDLLSSKEILRNKDSDSETDAQLTPKNKLTNCKKPQASDPAYVIYTSGSTGKPKGVVISHRAIVNRLEWMQHEYQLMEHDVVLQKTPTSFDVSVWELFWPLIQGATLMMAPPQAHRDPQQLLTIIQQYKITRLHFVPSMLAALLAYIKDNYVQQDIRTITASLTHVYSSGEALSNELAQNFHGCLAASLDNLYGPTEAAVDVTYYSVDAEILPTAVGVPIGKPVWNTQLRILDQQLRQVAIGRVGELYLCGTQLANGYLNRADLTATRFVADPFSTGERMYRTGDLVRWLADGAVEYLGRCDEQIKIRGQRVEIGEIEQVLQGFTEVKQAVVDARDMLVSSGNKINSDNRQLVAYLIPQNASAEQLNNTEESRSLLQKLANILPSHMLPTTLFWVDSFPLSANGKLDRKALPAPQVLTLNKGRAPLAGVENEIAKVFAKLLGVSEISAQDDFFLLGGHSLLAMRLAAELSVKLQQSVSVGQIMVSSSVEELAEVLSNQQLRNDPSRSGFGELLPIRKVKGESDSKALICINPGSGFSWQYTGFPKYLNGNYPIIGLQSPRPDGAVAISKNMQEAVEHYWKLLRQVQPSGPYHFLGYSFGGTIAIELAAKLERLGESVAFVGLLDTYPPEGQEWKRPTEAEALQEVEREKSQFMLAAQGEYSDPVALQQQQKMFRDIVANYDDTVRLLAAAKTTGYQGKVTIFVAEKSLPQGWDVAQSWAPYVQQLQQHRLPFSHDDLLSPQSLEQLGVLLDAELQSIDSLQKN